MICWLLTLILGRHCLMPCELDKTTIEVTNYNQNYGALFADATNKTLGLLLSKTVAPLIQPLLQAYSKPVSKNKKFQYTN